MIGGEPLAQRFNPIAATALSCHCEHQAAVCPESENASLSAIRSRPSVAQGVITCEGRKVGDEWRGLQQRAQGYLARIKQRERFALGRSVRA